MTPPAPPRSPGRAPVPDALRHYARMFVILTVFAWIVAEFPFPLRFGLVLAAAAAGAAGITALVLAIKTPDTMLLRGLLVIGGVMVGYLGLQGLGYVLIAPDVLAYEDCMKTAITEQRSHQCRAEYRDAVFDRYGVEVP